MFVLVSLFNSKLHVDSFSVLVLVFELSSAFLLLLL